MHCPELTTAILVRGITIRVQLSTLQNKKSENATGKVTQQCYTAFDPRACGSKQGFLQDALFYILTSRNGKFLVFLKTIFRYFLQVK